ncbi:NAD(P)/FAD-dependent oxidoreductase [Rhodococcus sp. NPDC059968]|uniref:NAD(P)/FAD-dependent oxidoreductase n=1 Tax=Rhodococcus sp. NPDC059968 TaxID=3347017 RepID=UPI00366EAF04
MKHIVIAGAGHAGVQLADSLRGEGFTAPITLVNNENGLPYQRPPLSKDFLTAGGSPQTLPLKARKFFADNDITLIESNPIVRIDRSACAVQLANQETLSYSDLVLAIGARNRSLPVPGAQLDGVHYLRTASEASLLHTALTTARTAVVIGAGFIGLEFATAARTRGIAVTVIEHGQRPMARVLSEEMSQHFAYAHASAGIRLVFGEAINALEGDNFRVCAAIGQSGERYPADIVVIGIGVEPNTELATAAELSTRNGIAVDPYLRTSDEHIWAIGDCAHFPCTHAGAPTRLESVQNAVDHARALARTLSGTPTEYHQVPWFWSHQGPHKLQIAGIAGKLDDSVVHGDPPNGKFSVFRFRNGALTCVESLNSPAVHIAARKILASPLRLTLEDIAIENFDLRRLVKRLPVT